MAEEKNPIEQIEEKVTEKPVEAVEPEKKVPEEAKEPEKKETPEFKGRGSFDRNSSSYKNRRAEMERQKKEDALTNWVPKTKLGKEVKTKKIKDIDEILDNNKKILEAEIVDTLIEVKTDLISIGQSKGKFGGGKRRAWRQTQRKTKEGNVPTFSAFAVIGDENGHIGVGVGKSVETLPARDKASRNAKLNVMKVVRGDGSFDSVGGGNTSIPFKVEGKAGSVRVTLMPAAPGTGLVVADQLKKILKMAGIKDIYSKTSGKIRTSFNLVKACIDALKKTNPKENKK